MQRARFRDTLRRVSPARPVFILGHWRSGTSLLHELLSLDGAFIAPTTFACFNPNNFLLSSNPLGEPSNAVQRPTGDFMVATDSPQEEEFALLCLAGASAYEAFMFPDSIRKLNSLSNPMLFSGDESMQWKEGLLEFLLGVLYAADRPGRLLLKSPTNSFRVETLNGLFPDATFVVISREPVAVFKSTLAMWQRMWERYAFTPALSGRQLEEEVARARLAMEERLEAGLSSIPAQRCKAIRYEELVANPSATIRALCEKLNLADPDPLIPRVETYMAEHVRLAREAPLAKKTLRWIQERWKPLFEKYDYPSH